MMICASKESDLEGKAGQKRLHIYVVIALVLLPIITLAYNIIKTVQLVVTGETAVYVRQ